MLQYSNLWGFGNLYQISMVRRSYTRTFFTSRRRRSFLWAPGASTMTRSKLSTRVESISRSIPGTSETPDKTVDESTGARI
jgi:hypothetical protein